MTVRAVSSNPASPFYNANAPTLTGQVGSLTAVLDAVLVNGFTGFTALGWSINQTTTNRRGYKQNLTGSNNASGMLLYVDDTGPGAGAAKEARACGFETMSAITPTGTGQFPTAAQSTIGTGLVAIRKSNTADATTRPWTIVGNGQTFYLFIESGDITAPLAAATFVFGDFKSYKPSDQYAVFIMGRLTENSANAQPDAMQFLTWCINSTTITLANVGWGHFIARHWTGSGGSVRCGKVTCLNRFGLVAVTGLSGPWPGTDATVQSTFSNVTTTIGRFATSSIGMAIPYPHGPDGGIVLSQIELNHSGCLRGYLPGLWAPLHDKPLNHNDVIAFTSGNMSGKTILAQQFPFWLNSGSDCGQVIVETSDTWS